MTPSNARNGTADSTWPSWPLIPVSWVSSGTRSAGNQCGTSRRTEMKVTASPSPTTARAASARGSESVSAIASCPVTISAAPETIRILEP